VNDFTLYILTAFALMFVIEGLIYALFPDAVQRMMAMAISLPQQRLRRFGLAMATLGFFIIWMMPSFIQTENP